ncbi:MAG: aldolase/citrate lyase family protein [Thermocrispum sp.]
MPDDRPDRFAKTVASAADAVILDLQDAVGAGNKDDAREHVRQWLVAGHDAMGRVNSAGGPWHDDDIAMAAELAQAVMVPNAQSPTELASIAARLPQTWVIPLIEPRWAWPRRCRSAARPESYAWRSVAESYAMQRATSRVSRRDLAAAREVNDAMEQAESAGDSNAVRDLDRQFHFFFYERCGMPALRDQINGMWQAFPWDLMLNSDERIANSRREHLEILTAVADGDIDSVAEATERHIRNGFAAITAHLTGTTGADPFDLDID